MLAAFLIVFREMIEAGLIVGIVLAATRGVARRGWWAAGGIAGGVTGACILAFFADRLAGLFEGAGQELFNAAILAAAVCMLAWHNIWMAGHGRVLAQNMRRLGSEVSAGQRPMAAMALVVGIAVLREGSEVVLFLYGIATGGVDPGAMIWGGLGGVAAGTAISALIYGGLVAVPLRQFFKVTGLLITFLAAGLAAQAAAFLQQAGLLQFWTASVWNTGAYLSQNGLAGRLLHGLIGYNEAPSGLQLAVYVGTLALITCASRLSGRLSRPPARPVVNQGQPLQANSR